MGADHVARLIGRAMGTDVDITVVGPNGLAEDLANEALGRLGNLEALWSRFRSDSEISRLNRANGEFVIVGDETRRLLRTAIDAWELSGGFVDATKLEALLAAGYDRSFELLAADRSSAERARPIDDRRSPQPPLRRHGPTDIEITATAARLPMGIGFDPGGIGKGLAADLVSAAIMRRGADGVCIDVGGDLRVRGTAPDSTPTPSGGWTISIDHPVRDEPLALVGIGDGAVASSTTLCRAWQIDGERRHHLIDPRTEQPAASGVAFAAAIAADGWRAETMAKTLLLRGGPHWFDPIDGSGIEALIVTDDGSVHTSTGFGRFCTPEGVLS
ncbi:MAG: FAD:protein FMN transferase [Acidimicrobiales bacterium]